MRARTKLAMSLLTVATLVATVIGVAGTSHAVHGGPFKLQTFAGLTRGPWCLDGWKNYPGGNMYLYQCHSPASPQQVWHFGLGDPYSRNPPGVNGGGVQIKHGNLCLEIAGDFNGARARLDRCNGSPEQGWYIRSANCAVGCDKFGYKAYQNGLGWPYGKCLDADITKLGNFARVQAWDCNQSGQQAWTQVSR
jgi:Ricin-type beta-trefoil lectin domain